MTIRFKTVFVLVALVACGFMPTSAEARKGKSKQVVSATKARPEVPRKLFFPTRSQIPLKWVRHDYDKECVVYAAPDVENKISFPNNAREHWFNCTDFILGVVIWRDEKAGVDPGYSQEFKDSLMKDSLRFDQTVLKYKWLSYNIVERDVRLWIGKGEVSGFRVCFQKVRSYQFGELFVQLIVRSSSPLGPGATKAMENFSDTLSIDPELGERLAERYRAEGYTVRLSHNPEPKRGF